jgi:hypothetical protein
LSDLQMNDVRVVCSYEPSDHDDLDTVVIDLIIIITSSGEGQIFTPRLQSIENDFLRTSSELRALLSSSEVWDGFGTTLTRRWAFGISELLQLVSH